ncbi:MAG: hypothetical protein JXL84_00060 [Deltaproteobacteria bacterium]|nr:hypothetical protein [Deltaproteobacteria bacterium]
MPSTTIHINDELLSKIDQIAGEKAISRNRFIMDACETAVSNLVPSWPEGFFDMDLSKKDLRLLRESVSEMEEAILVHRRNRGGSDQ